MPPTRGMHLPSSLRIESSVLSPRSETPNLKLASIERLCVNDELWCVTCLRVKTTKTKLNQQGKLKIECLVCPEMRNLHVCEQRCCDRIHFVFWKWRRRLKYRFAYLERVEWSRDAEDLDPRCESEDELLADYAGTVDVTD